MRLLLLVVSLVLVLTACVPRFTATPERDGEEVIVVLTAADSLYAVSLIALNGVTTDSRCVTLDELDSGCLLGDIAGGEQMRVSFAPAGTEAFYCTAFGFTSEDQRVNSYRAIPCKGGEL